ncbi:MAG: DHHA1 domain-containing protein [Patescibacteria group bacterium]
MSKFIEHRGAVRSAKKGIIVLYHINCTDGFGAAYAAWKKFGNRANYIPVQHQAPPPRGLRGKEIYTVDFSYPMLITQKLLRENKRLTSIDHHISAKEATLSTHKPLYAVNHSGAVLSWKYFHPSKNVPRLLLHIEDTDIWKFALPKTREVFAYLDLFDFNFKTWDRLIHNFENTLKRKHWISAGAILLKHERRLIARLVANNKELVHFVGKNVYAINSPLFQSELGHILSGLKSPFAIVWKERDGQLFVSLRGDGSIDVSKIAQRYGGGGHKGAAGFTVPINKKPWKVIRRVERV